MKIYMVLDDGAESGCRHFFRVGSLVVEVDCYRFDGLHEIGDIEINQYVYLDSLAYIGEL